MRAVADVDEDLALILVRSFDDIPAQEALKGS
jgi:hypothetical protein